MEYIYICIFHLADFLPLQWNVLNNILINRRSLKTEKAENSDFPQLGRDISHREELMFVFSGYDF